MPPVALWKNLADPCDPDCPAGRRCEVVVWDEPWRHIIDKHIRPGREPWGDWLSDDLVMALKDLWQANQDRQRNLLTLQRLAIELENAVRASLDRPLVMTYVQITKPEASKGIRHWLLVLPIGATTIIRSTNRNFIVSCFFMDSVCHEPDSFMRWRRAVSQIVWRYGTWQRTSDGVRLAPPDTNDPVRFCEEGEEFWRTQVRFVTAANWGFRREPGGDGVVWQSDLGTWPVADVSDQQPYRFRLNQAQPAPDGTEV